MKHQSHKTVVEKDVGARTVAGTDWPITDVAQRVQLCGWKRPEWQILRGLCNGVPDRVEKFATRQAMLAAL